MGDSYCGYNPDVVGRPGASPHWCCWGGRPSSGRGRARRPGRAKGSTQVADQRPSLRTRLRGLSAANF